MIIGKPKKKYRVIVQERLSSRCRKEKARSFMIYDIAGNSNIDAIVTMLNAKSKREKDVRTSKTR